MRRGVVAADGLDPAVRVDQLELLLGVQDDTVEEGHLVERAREGALHARAVVAPDVEDKRVVQVAGLLDGVEESAYVPVRVLGVAGEDLHLSRVELLCVIGERVPGGEEVGTFGQLGVLGHQSEPLLTRQSLPAVGVPALVERALVPVGPLLRDVVRGVAAAGRVVHEPRLPGVLGSHRVQPLYGLVGEVVGEVVQLAAFPSGTPSTELSWVMIGSY